MAIARVTACNRVIWEYKPPTSINSQEQVPQANQIYNGTSTKHFSCSGRKPAGPTVQIRYKLVGCRYFGSVAMTTPRVAIATPVLP